MCTAGRKLGNAITPPHCLRLGVAWHGKDFLVHAWRYRFDPNGERSKLDLACAGAVLSGHVKHNAAFLSLNTYLRILICQPPVTVSKSQESTCCLQGIQGYCVNRIGDNKASRLLSPI